MTKAEFLLRLSFEFANVPEGDLTHPSLRLMRDKFAVIYADARLAMPCDHPESEITNGTCFQCGSRVTSATIFAD